MICPVEGQYVITKGAGFSYYEFKWPANDRLTDEKWRDILKSNTQPQPPTWTQSFFNPGDGVVISNREFREWQKKESFYLTRLIITPQQVKVGDQLVIEFSANDDVDEATTAVFIHTKQNTYRPFNVQKHENQKYHLLKLQRSSLNSEFPLDHFYQL